MKLLELDVCNFRGIRQLHLTPHGKNLLIVGPNGSGKSSVVDAIDFLLTGRITRLTGKGTGHIYLNRHGPHIDCTPEDAQVSATIRIPGYGKDVSISRCIAQPNSLVCDPPHVKGKVEELGKLALNGHHVLTRREILHYITAEDGTRAEEIQALLDLKDIEDIRKALTKVQNDSEKARNNANRALGIAKGQIIATTQQQDFREDQVLVFINQHRRLLKGEPLESLSIEGLKEGISPPTVIVNTKQTQVSLLGSDIQNLRGVFDSERIETFKVTESRLRQLVYILQENPGILKGYNYQQLIELGLSLLDGSGNCPLCGVHWDQPGQLVAHIEEELSSARLSEQYHKEIQDLSTKCVLLVDSLMASIGRVATTANLLKLENEHNSLQAWIEALERLSKALSKPVEKYTLDRFEQPRVHVLYTPDNLEAILTHLENTVKDAFPKSTPEQVSWDTLTRLEENLKALEKAQHEFETQDVTYQRASYLETEFEKARDKILGELYATIQNRFVELYKTLHEADEREFEAVMRPEGAGLVFEVDFHGRGSHPPHAMHSEGHQDSMGLCLYLALAEHLTRGKIDTFILDDVVMSVDADHRRQLCQLFMKFFPNRQIVLTTHDKTWANQLKSEGVVASRAMIELYNWDLVSGPQVNSTTDIWDLINQDLKKNDIPSASARLRRGSEEYFATVCDALQAQVRYKENGRWELGDFLPAAISQYRQLVKKAQKSAISWAKPEENEKFKEIESQSSQVFERSNAEQWGINAAVHYNQWVNLTMNDFVPLVEAFQDLWSLFRCNTCGSIIKVSTSGPKMVQVYCNCNSVNWNLRKKGEDA